LSSGNFVVKGAPEAALAIPKAEPPKASPQKPMFRMLMPQRQTAQDRTSKSFPAISSQNIPNGLNPIHISKAIVAIVWHVLHSTMESAEQNGPFKYVKHEIAIDLVQEK
jgi:hypothetical protein